MMLVCVWVIVVIIIVISRYCYDEVDDGGADADANAGVNVNVRRRRVTQIWAAELVNKILVLFVFKMPSNTIATTTTTSEMETTALLNRRHGINFPENKMKNPNSMQKRESDCAATIFQVKQNKSLTINYA